MKRLTTESNLQRLVVQFVPIKIDVESDDYKLWRRDHKPSRNAIPQMYIVRADGEEVFNQVGGLPTETLEKVLGTALQKSGVTLTDREVEQLAQANRQAQKHFDKENYIEAMKTMAAVPGVIDESIVCYAEPVIEIRQLLSAVSEKIKAQFDRLNSQIREGMPDSIEDRIELAQTTSALVRETRRFDLFDDFRSELELVVKKNAELSQLVADLGQLESLLKSRASNRAEKLGSIAARYPDSSIERKIRKDMASSQPTTKWTQPRHAEFRTWTSSNGKFTIDAKPILISKTAVRLENRKGEQVTVKIADLSDEDQKWLKNDSEK